MFGIGTPELLIILVILAVIFAKTHGVELPDLFSLRTLLIATTIIAILFGLITYRPT